jgi:hypothetical protein
MGKMKIGSGNKANSTRTSEAPLTDWEMETSESTEPQFVEFKPKFIVAEIEETIEKPVFNVVDVENIVEKPTFSVQENIELVEKPSFEIIQSVETVMKPVYVIKDVHYLVQNPIISSKIQLIWPAISLISLAFSIYSHFAGR